MVSFCSETSNGRGCRQTNAACSRRSPTHRETRELPVRHENLKPRLAHTILHTTWDLHQSITHLTRVATTVPRPFRRNLRAPWDLLQSGWKSSSDAGSDEESPIESPSCRGSVSGLGLNFSVFPLLHGNSDHPSDPFFETLATGRLVGTPTSSLRF